MIKVMYIKWKINNQELSEYSLEEFDKNDESVYGFMLLELGDFQLGYLDEDNDLCEGNEDIAYYIDKLIECGSALLEGRKFKVLLLNSNLLEIHVAMNQNVKIEVVNIMNKDVEYDYTINLDELISEIKNDYAKYIEDIKEINECILKSKLISETDRVYRDFLMLLDK